MKRFRIPCEDSRHTQRNAVAGHIAEPTPAGGGHGLVSFQGDVADERIEISLSGYLCDACVRIRRLVEQAQADANPVAWTNANIEAGPTRGEVIATLNAGGTKTRKPPQVEAL